MEQSRKAARNSATAPGGRAGQEEKNLKNSDYPHWKGSSLSTLWKASILCSAYCRYGRATRRHTRYADYLGLGLFCLSAVLPLSACLLPAALPVLPLPVGFA